MTWRGQYPPDPTTRCWPTARCAPRGKRGRRKTRSELSGRRAAAAWGANLFMYARCRAVEFVVLKCWYFEVVHAFEYAFEFVVFDLDLCTRM
jgi:hypothetical protein